MKYLQSAKITVEGKEVFLKSTTNPNGIHFDFTVSRQRFEAFADINVTFYNLGEDTIKALNKKVEAFRNSAQIKCEAGYQGRNKLVFTGTVYSCKTSYSVGEKITNVVVSSYSNRLIDKVVSVAYKRSPKFSEALQKLCTEAGIQLNISGLQFRDDHRLGNNGFCFAGTIPEFIRSQVTPQIAIEFYNERIIVSSLQTTRKPPVEILTPQNGLIGTPSLTDQNLVQAQTLFNPDYQILSFIKIETERFYQRIVEGEIYKLNHNFASVGATSTIEVLPLGQQIPRNNIGVIK